MHADKTKLRLVGMGLALLGTLYAYQKAFRQYPGVEYDDFPLPPDWQQPAEWAFARLMYPQVGGRFRGYGSSGSGEWTRGYSIWTQDYPRADRHFSMALRRLSRVDVRSVEQPVNLDDGDDAYNWPWLAAGEMGDWILNEDLAAKLRDYLLRGGFLMLDDWWGPDEW